MENRSGGDLSGKCCGLGPAGFPHGLRRVAAPAVPLYDRAAVLPAAGLDYHLVHTLIPGRPLANSLGIFCYNTPFPSLFCRNGFRSRLPRAQLAGFLRGILDGAPPPASSTIPTQGRLHCTQHLTMFQHRIAGLHCAVAVLLTLVQPPRLSQASSRGGSSPACHCGSPFLPAAPAEHAGCRIPSSSPRLGIGSHHQGPHRCAR